MTIATKLAGLALAAATLSGCGAATPILTSQLGQESSTSSGVPARAATTEALPGTPGQRNAIRKGESYLRSQAFSRAGLLDQLDYEDYTAAEAEYAVAYVESQAGPRLWFDQAVRKGESYLRSQAFSFDGLLDQLRYEEFTEEQAQHGATVAYGGQ